MKKFALLLATVALALTSCNKTEKKAPELTPAQQDYATAMRGFYLWRCGTAVEGDYNGNHYCTEACHLNDAYGDYIGHPGEKFDAVGGWHDAGDFGKYTVNAALTLANLFYAWDHFNDAIKDVKLDLPETAPGYPEFLEELKWETDFLLKMQYPEKDGRVAHKLTRLNFAPFIMPQDDTEEKQGEAARRYFTPWSSAATADFAAIMAMASRYYAPYDKAYAKECLDAAIRSYDYLKANPEDFIFEQGPFSTGDYRTSDPDDRLWMAAELWEATGNPEYLTDLEARIQARIDAGLPLVMDNWDWQEMSNMGVWAYALSDKEGRNPELLAKVKEAIQADAKLINDRIQASKYGNPLAEYFWGCNGLAARNAINLNMATKLGGPDYSESIAKIKGYLTGNNVYGRSFVTGIGENPPMHPHDRRSAADGIDAPWPGYVVGGGHTETDWLDDQDDYARNEIAINWQAPLVYLFAAVMAQEPAAEKTE